MAGVEIYEVDSGDQLGASVGSLSFGSLTPGTVPGDSGAYDFVNFSGSIGLAANTDYWVGVTALNGFFVLLDTESGASEGEFSLTGLTGFRQTITGLGERFSSSDGSSRILVDLQGSVAPIPLPASAFLLLGGLAFGAAATRRSKKS